ncbi:MAG TPA: VOC family protein [Longimicrobiaceae bacterium]|nr:VOC family protein [Longimicrobiaceae bacterium]
MAGFDVEEVKRLLGLPAHVRIPALVAIGRGDAVKEAGMAADERWTEAAGGPGETGYGIPPQGYRLPVGIRLGRVSLQVADLDRSLGYYQEVIGLRVLDRSDGSAALGAHGDDTVLVELHERPGAAPAPHRGRLGLYHFAILLPDRAALGRLVSHLAEIGAQAGASDHLVSEALYLQDPDGLGIEVYADRPRATWRYEGRQLKMDTRPLDVASLAHSAGGEPWTGAPSGTVIGHIHLHVGNLDEAAAFYHRALGLDQVVWSYPGALFLSAGGYHHHLGLNTWAGPGAERPRDGDARLLEWTMVVPGAGDADAAARSVEAAGYEVSGTEQGWTCADPWGTVLRLASSGDGR